MTTASTDAARQAVRGQSSSSPALISTMPIKRANQTGYPHWAKAVSTPALANLPRPAARNRAANRALAVPKLSGFQLLMMLPLPCAWCRSAFRDVLQCQLQPPAVLPGETVAVVE